MQKLVIMGEDDHFVNLGNLPDLIMRMTNGLVFDNEGELMPDEDHDKEFSALLQQKMKASSACFEAYTLVRQYVCYFGDVNNSGFCGTASFLCQWNNVSSLLLISENYYFYCDY